MALGCQVWTGDNRLENWRASLSPYASQLRDPSVTRSIKQMKRTKSEIEKMSEDFIESDRVEQAFAFAGAAIAASIYSISYPITFVDGPLPFADAAWLAGLLRVTRAGYDAGEFVGSFFS
mgnify:CR=1 FL=1|tara:strand:- start:266 stop:625 length:360 start_codon:yes stop_codon:yes gene_type:complete